MVRCFTAKRNFYENRRRHSTHARRNWRESGKSHSVYPLPFSFLSPLFSPPSSSPPSLLFSFLSFLCYNTLNFASYVNMCSRFCNRICPRLATYFRYSFLFVFSCHFPLVPLTFFPVILAISPLLAAGGAFMAYTLSTMTKRGLDSYAGAGGVAEESISNIRTVSTFNGQQKESLRYLPFPLPLPLISFSVCFPYFFI